MNRRLILMRHAKSSWADGSLRDVERPLNPRGIRDAPRMAHLLEDIGWAPGRVVSSSAVRTRETWLGMAGVLDVVPPVTFTDDLYHAGLAAIIAHAQGWPDDAGPVLLLGHNPGWEHAASTLCGEALHLTTANVVLLEGRGTSWVAALRQPWKLHQLYRPKALPPRSVTGP